MRILLINPSESEFVNLSKAKRTICPALPLLAAYTPQECEIIIADEAYGENVYLDNIDLVGITAMTSQANQAYKISEYYRKRGVKVVMGGIHASILPDEAIQHVDAVCIGEADSLWSQIVNDAANNNLKKIYRAEELFNLENVPHARYDLINTKRTLLNHSIVQITRGCPYNCEFCITSTLFGQKIRCRPIENIIEEIKLNPANITVFIDDNIFSSKSYCEKLFKALIPLKIRWGGQASLNIATKDLALLKLAKKSGCIGLFVGIESINQLSQTTSDITAKLGNADLREMSRKIKIFIDHGIFCHTSMIFGLDGDDHTCFEKTIEFLINNNVSLSSFCILTPYPGTRLYERLKQEGRLLHENWSKYCNQHVVFQPKNMTPEQLKRGSDWAGQEFYTKRSILKRFWANRRALIPYVLLNVFTRQANYRNNIPGIIQPMTTNERLAWQASLNS